MHNHVKAHTYNLKKKSIKSEKITKKSDNSNKMEFEIKPEQPPLYHLLWCRQPSVLIRATATALARESQAVVVRKGCLGSREADWTESRQHWPFPSPLDVCGLLCNGATGFSSRVAGSLARCSVLPACLGREKEELAVL